MKRMFVAFLAALREIRELKNWLQNSCADKMWPHTRDRMDNMTFNYVEKKRKYMVISGNVKWHLGGGEGLFYVWGNLHVHRLKPVSGCLLNK